MTDTGKQTPKTYTWTYKDGKINCCTSKESSCTVSKFWEVGELTSFHDAQLQEATREINAILQDVRKRNADSKRELSLIQINDRHLLVWTHPGPVGPSDESAKIRRMLRLKKTK